MGTSNAKPFSWVYSGSTKSVLYPPSSHRLHCFCKFTMYVAIKLPSLSLIRHQCVIQLSILFCCVALCRVRALRVAEHSSNKCHDLSSDEIQKQRSGLLRCYFMTSGTLSPTLRRNIVQSKCYDLEDESVIFFRTIGNTLSVSTT